MYPCKCSILMIWILTSHCLTLHVCAAAVCWPNILCQLYWGWCPVQSPIQGHPSPSLQRSVAGASLQEKYMLGISLLIPPYTLYNTLSHWLCITYVFKPDMPLKHVSALTLTRIALLYGHSPIVLCWWEKKPTHPDLMPFFCANSNNTIPTNGAAMEGIHESFPLGHCVHKTTMM